MKKISTLLFAIAILLGGLVNAQNQIGLAPKLNSAVADKRTEKSDLITKGTKAITEGKITTSTKWVNGSQILEFSMTYAQSGAEYMDGLEMVFPAGMVPNAVGTSDPLTTPNGGGSAHLNLSLTGQTLLWGVDTMSKWGAYSGGTFTFHVAVANSGLVGDQTINYTVYGDGYGNDPHIVTDFVVISEAQDHDLGIVAIAPTFINSGSTETPIVTVHNFGGNNENTWSLTLTDGGSYTSTVSNTPINAGQSLQVTMDGWTPADGDYTLTATLTFAEDGDASNNTLTQNVSVLPIVDAFAWVASREGGVGVTGKGPINIALPTGVMSQISVDNSEFIAAADYVGEEIYGIRFFNSGDCPLVKIDPITGVVTNIGGGASLLTGFTYDITTKTAYVMDVNGMLSTIDLATGAVTNIGGSYNTPIALACNAQGDLYAISVDSDDLAKINKQTGEATAIGALGIDIIFAQDICFDRDNDILYGTLYAGGGGLYAIDITTGAANLLADVKDELAGFAIPYTKNYVANLSNNQISVYPNPSDGMVNVQVSEKSVVTVFDLSGRVVATYNIDANEILNFNQAAGMYLLKVESKGGVSTHKLIIK